MTAAQLSLLPSGRFWVVTLSGISSRRTFGPFTEREASEFAARHGRPTSNFVIPVKTASDDGR